jgi:acetoin utilization protein AcuB
VVQDDRLVGVITASDVLRAFLDVMGASQGGSVRLDLVLEGEEHGFIEASRIVAREGGDVLGVGTYRDKLGENPVCYLRMVGGNAEKIAKALRVSGFNVLGVHRIGATPTEPVASERGD